MTLDHDGVAPLGAILSDQLTRRPWREPDYKRENAALSMLMAALAESPSRILQTLADTILDVTDADSAGLSLVTTINGEEQFYWPAIAGIWRPHVGGGTPRQFGPCGDVLDRNEVLLFFHPERRYHYLRPVMPPAVECLLVPFSSGGTLVGTVWALAHDDRRKFDAEDVRLMLALARFASIAYAVVNRIDEGARHVSESSGAGSTDGSDGRVTATRRKWDEVQLSPRERECLALLVAGYSYREAGRRLSVTAKTVETYRRRVIKKLGASSRADLVAYALRTGILPRTTPNAL